MKRFSLLLILMLVLGGAVTNGQTVTLDNVTKWHDDLTYLANTLPARHPNLFLKLAKPLWHQAVAELDAQLPKLSGTEFVAGIARIVALPGDSHTFVNLNQTGFGFHYYPLAFIWLQDGYYVTGTTPEHQALLGAKLLRINGKDTASVERDIAALIPHETDSWLKEMTPYSINAAEILAALHITTQSHTASFDFQTREGSVLTAEMQAVSLKENLEWQILPDTRTTPLPLYLQNRNRFYWYQYLPEGQSIYMQYNSCRETPSASFAKFSKNLFGFIDKHPVSRMIIDLRFNKGGNPAVLDPFVKEIKKRSGLTQPGRLMVLIGRQTFDAAVVNAVKLRAECNAVWIGEPTGGKPSYFGDVKTFRLPNTGIEITYGTKYIETGKTAVDSLIPDLPVEVTPQEYFQGFDPVLIRALQ